MTESRDVIMVGLRSEFRKHGMPANIRQNTPDPVLAVHNIGLTVMRFNKKSLMLYMEKDDRWVVAIAQKVVEQFGIDMEFSKENWRLQRCSNCGETVYIDDERRNFENIRMSYCPECRHTLTVTGR